MLTARPRLAALILFSFVIVVPAFAQSVDVEQREGAWRSYKLPRDEFARYVDAEKAILFRVPAAWAQSGYLQFKGPNDADLKVVVEKIPDGVPLKSLTNAVLQNLRNLPGGADSLTVRRTEISGLEAREFLFNLADPRGQMTRRMIWSTVWGPHAFSFVFIVPETAAAELEPYFKAVIESAVIFESDAHYTIFDNLRSAAIKESKPARIDEVRSLVAVIDGFDAGARSKSVDALASIFNSAPDSVLDLLIDRRPVVRAAAVVALGRSSNRALDGFLLQALADPSAVVGARAARALSKREDVVKLLRDDSAGWSGLQTERVMRAMALMDERPRNQIVEELTRDAISRARTPKPRLLPPTLPPPPPAERPAAENKQKQSVPPPKKGGISGGVPGGIPSGLPARIQIGPTSFVSVAGYNDEAASLGMFPDLDAIAPALSATTLIESSGAQAARLALTLALDSRTRLPADRLIKLLSSDDGDVARLAARNLAVSATAVDVARIEAFAKTVYTVSGLKPGDSGYHRPLPDELALTVKKIRWREQFAEAATQVARGELIKQAFADDELATFAWPYIRDLVEGGGPKQPRPIVSVQTSNALPADSKPGARIVLPLAENVFPSRVTFYTAIPDAQALIDKLADSLASIQLESARSQANVLLMMKAIELQFAKGFDARPEVGILKSSGIEPHAPIALARWTAEGAPRGLATAQRTAVIIRVADRDRFENFIATYQRQLGRFETVPEYLSIGARMFAMLPALVPLVASAINDRTPPYERFEKKYTLVGSNNCNGYPVTVIERRELGYAEPIHRDTVYLTYVGDAAVLATDWFSLRDCLTRLEGKGETLASNAEFKRASALGGDVIYMSDLLAVFGSTADRADKKAQIAEQGALKISKSSWESSFDFSFNAREWVKPQPFKIAQLKSPSELLPQSSMAYLFTRIDVAQAWRAFGRDLFSSDTVKQLESIWSVDLEREVLAELGPECGVVLLGLPSMKGSSFDAPWAVFIQTKSDKLATAFAQGKLLKGVGQTSKAAKVKVGSSDYWIAVKNGFLIIAGCEEAIDKLGSSERLTTARDFERAARNVPGEVIAFGGVNIEAAASTIKADPADPVNTQAIEALAALARAFHSQNIYATMTDDRIKAHMSVSLSREGRYSVSELASLSKDYQFAAAEIEARGVPIADQRRIESLTVRITSKAPGAIDRINSDISGVAQLTDKRSDSELVLTVRPRAPTAIRKVELPVKAPELADYLKPTPEIRSDAQTVINQAREIAGDDRDAWSVARKLADWTYKNLKWKSVDKADAAQTLATREADCLEFSQLFIAMARSLGLPSRMVTGLAHTGSSFGGHAWAEVWAGEWVELDPTWGTNFVDATHIRSAAFELDAYAALNLIGIEVLDAKRGVPDFQKDPVKLADVLSNGSDADTLENALGAAIEPSILIDAVMGEGTWSGMSSAERDQVYSEHRRLVVELHDVFKDELGLGAGARVLKVTRQGDHADALLMLSGWKGGMISVRLVHKRDAWFVEELRYEDLAYNLISESMRSTAIVLEAKRNKKTLPALIDSPQTRILLARQKDLNTAVEIADQSLKETPDNASLLYLKALCLLGSSKKSDDAAQKEGVKLLTELSNRQSPFAPAVRELGDFYADFEEGDAEIEARRDKAVDLFRRYAGLVPEDPRPHENMAAIYEARHDFARAEAEYRVVIERDPLSPDNYSALARFLLTQGRYKDALEAIDRRRGRGSSKDDMFADLFSAIDGDKDAVARVEVLAVAAAERLAKNFRANMNLAWTRIGSGRPSEALPLLKTAAELGPKSAEPHVALGDAHRKLHNWAAALKAADTAIRMDPENADAYFHKACALAQLRRPVEAIAALKKAIELDEDLTFAEDELEAEPDLKPLAALPAFKKLVQDTKQPGQAPDDLKKKNDK